MNLDEFYSENEFDIWKTILGDKLHYHLGSKSSGDIFDQAIINLFPHIENKSKVLDCGCGWGGPARVLIDKLNCNVTGVTVSEKQAHSIIDFPVHHCDLNYYNLIEFYDVAIFVESFCHFKNPINILKKLHSNIGKIIIKDYVWNCEWYNENWGMYMRPKSSYVNILKKSSYEIIKINLDDTTDVVSSCEYWMNNIKKLDENLINGQVKKLKDLCTSVLNNRHMTAIHTVLIVARPV